MWQFHRLTFFLPKSQVPDLSLMTQFSPKQNVLLKKRIWGWKVWEETTLIQMVKNLPAMQEAKVWYLGQEDPLEKKMATHSSILAWRIPRTEQPGRSQFMRSQRAGRNWVTKNNTLNAFASCRISYICFALSVNGLLKFLSLHLLFKMNSSVLLSMIF